MVFQLYIPTAQLFKRKWAGVSLPGLGEIFLEPEPPRLLSGTFALLMATKGRGCPLGRSRVRAVDRQEKLGSLALCGRRSLASPRPQFLSCPPSSPFPLLLIIQYIVRCLFIAILIFHIVPRFFSLSLVLKIFMKVPLPPSLKMC